MAAAARENGLKVHRDGARLFNAAVAMGVKVSDYAAHCDTVCFCLSKGLGAPVGSVLCGTRAAMREALRLRKQLGGGMRQVGVLAAAGLHALEHHTADLAEDHRRTRELRAALADVGYTFPMDSPTNILYIHAAEPFALVGALAGEGVFTLPHAADSIRAVLHRDIDDAMLAHAIGVFRSMK